MYTCKNYDSVVQSSSSLSLSSANEHSLHSFAISVKPEQIIKIYVLSYVTFDLVVPPENGGWATLVTEWASL